MTIPSKSFKSYLVQFKETLICFYTIPLIGQKDCIPLLKNPENVIAHSIKNYLSLSLVKQNYILSTDSFFENFQELAKNVYWNFPEPFLNDLCLKIKTDKNLIISLHSFKSYLEKNRCPYKLKLVHDSMKRANAFKILKHLDQYKSFPALKNNDKTNRSKLLNVLNSKIFEINNSTNSELNKNIGDNKNSDKNTLLTNTKGEKRPKYIGIFDYSLTKETRNLICLFFDSDEIKTENHNDFEKLCKIFNGELDPEAITFEEYTNRHIAYFLSKLQKKSINYNGNNKYLKKGWPFYNIIFFQYGPLEKSNYNRTSRSERKKIDLLLNEINKTQTKL